MEATPPVDGPLGLPSGTGTNSSISSLDPTVVNILKNKFGFKLKDRSLESHSADASGPQGSEPGELSSLSESVSAPKSEFQSLIEEAKKYENTQIENFNIEAAKQVLGKLIQTCKDSEPSGNLGFLKAAFRAITLHENEADVANNIKHLLRLSKGKIETKDIIDEFKNIGDVDRRIEFLGRLQKNLSDEEKTEFKDFLTGALDGVADQIADKFEKNQDKDQSALLSKLESVDSLRTALLAEGKVGVPFLAKLMNDNKLPSLKLTEGESKKLLDTLVNCGDTGRNCLEKLINEDKLQSLSLGKPSESKKFACELLEQGPSGLAVVKALIKKGKLDLRQFKDQDIKEFAEALLKCGQAGNNKPDDLINDNTLPNLKQAKDESKNLLDTLANCGATGRNCLAELINENRLPHCPLLMISRFANDLIKIGLSGLAVIKALIRKDKLELKTDTEEFVNEMLKSSEESRNYLAELINEGKLQKSALVEPSESKKFAYDALARGLSGLAVVKALINAGKLNTTNFSSDEAKEFAKALLANSSSGADYVIELINDSSGSKLPTLSLGEPPESKKFACALLSRGPAGLDAVKALINAGKLNLEQFEAQEAKEFAEALLANSSSGADYVIELINDSSGSKLPKLASPGEVKTRAFQFKELYSTFERGITEAFLGETSNVDDRSWEAIRSQLGSLTLAKARGIWQTIANEIAASCFSENGEIDGEKLKGLMAFLGHKEIFKKPPYCFIPNVELMRSQMYMVCERLLNKESLLNKKSEALDLLNAANGITVGTHGQAILKAMKLPEGSKPAVAILSSLFTPHRQKYLPTCTINSLINAEIRNHPERLIEMYRQMLGSDQFTLPSGYAIRQKKIRRGFITVDLTNGGDGKNLVFRAITSGDTDKVKKRKERWLKEGITYPESGNPEDKYKLRLPVHNMN
ncbi:MAG: hypothetical protein LBQ23_00555, partial [Puniceicoccales bacterium]|nr:hypothetical protein [Puniceicoccales bacterium]